MANFFFQQLSYKAAFLICFKHYTIVSTNNSLVNLTKCTYLLYYQNRLLQASVPGQLVVLHHLLTYTTFAYSWLYETLQNEIKMQRPV